MKLLLPLFLSLFFSCNLKNDSTTVYKNLYSKNLQNRTQVLNNLGEWEYTLDGKDSIWKQTDFTYNLKLIDKVLHELKPFEKEWDSLLFLSKKHDSIPFPSDLTLERNLSYHKRKSNVAETRNKVKKLVELGAYSVNGKKRGVLFYFQKTVLK